MNEKPAPWERQPYESAADFRLFQLYLEQDPPRSVNAAYRKYKQRGRKEAQVKHAPGSWRNLANGKTRHSAEIPGSLTWAARTLAWDDYLADLERSKWVKRRLELKEKEWDVGSRLMEKAEQMLMFPVIRTESENGYTLIMPAGWKLSDIPNVANAASKLARLAANMATENIDIDWRVEAAKEGVVNPDAIFRQLVEQFKARLDGSDAAGSVAGSPPPAANDHE